MYAHAFRCIQIPIWSCPAVAVSLKTYVAPSRSEYGRSTKIDHTFEDGLEIITFFVLKMCTYLVLPPCRGQLEDVGGPIAQRVRP